MPGADLRGPPSDLGVKRDRAQHVPEQRVENLPGAWDGNLVDTLRYVQCLCQVHGRKRRGLANLPEDLRPARSVRLTEETQPGPSIRRPLEPHLPAVRVVRERDVLPGRMPQLEQRLIRPGTVPVDEPDGPAVAADRAVRAEIPVADDLAREDRVGVLAPDRIRRLEVRRRIVQRADEPSDLDQRLVGQPAGGDAIRWPRVQSLELATTPSMKLSISRPWSSKPSTRGAPSKRRSSRCRR